MAPPRRKRQSEFSAPVAPQSACSTDALIWPTSACRPTPQGRWCSDSRPPGATPTR